MDITVCVMLPPRGARDFSTSSHPKWMALAPVSVTLMRDTSLPITALRTGYIHVVGAPHRDLSELSAVLCAPFEDDVLGGVEPMKIQKAKRRWCLDHESLPDSSKAALLENRQIEMTWPQFKPLIKSADGLRKFPGV